MNSSTKFLLTAISVFCSLAMPQLTFAEAKQIFSERLNYSVRYHSSQEGYYLFESIHDLYVLDSEDLTLRHVASGVDGAPYGQAPVALGNGNVVYLKNNPNTGQRDLVRYRKGEPVNSWNVIKTGVRSLDKLGNGRALLVASEQNSQLIYLLGADDSFQRIGKSTGSTYSQSEGEYFYSVAEDGNALLLRTKVPNEQFNMYGLRDSEPFLLGVVGERDEPFNSVLAVNHNAGVMAVRAGLYPEEERCFYMARQGESKDFYCAAITPGSRSTDIATIDDKGLITLSYFYAPLKSDGSYDQDNFSYRIIQATDGAGRTLVYRSGPEGGIDKVVSMGEGKTLYTVPGRRSQRLMESSDGSSYPVSGITGIKELIDYRNGFLIVIEDSRLKIYEHTAN